MIHKLVNFALKSRFLVLVAAILLFVWGIVSFYRLPVEAYPDVANNYCDVIAQWPGISAEQIEQQVTIPMETVMNGIPGVAHVRSWSIFGLSTVEMVFGEETTNFENRERVLERLSQVTLPPGVVPQIGTDWSPVGQIYFYTLQSSNPQYDAMSLKTIETWVIEKNLKSVPGVPDTNPFGGPTREYQVRLDPDKLVSYGLSIGQVEQQLANNNANGGGSFIQAGLQQINVREVGQVRNIQDIENTVIMTKSGTALRVKDIAVVDQGPEIRLGQFGQTYHGEDGKLIDNNDVVSGIAVLQKGADAQPVLEGIHKKIKELNDQILPKGVKIVPFIDRSALLQFTTHTVLHNLTEGIILVVIILFLFLGNVRGAIIVALTIPFSLLFAAICLDLRHIPANLLSLGALDFGMVVDGAVVMVENIVRHLNRPGNGTRSVDEKIREAAHEVQRPVFYAIFIIIAAYLPIFTLQAVEGRLFRPMAWTVAFALLGALLFSMVLAPVLASFLFRKGAKEWKNPARSHCCRDVPVAQIKTGTLSAVLLAGAVGAFVSAQRRIQGVTDRGESLIDLIELSSLSSLLGNLWAPVSGAIFAVVLYAMFASQVVRGDAFPEIQTIHICPHVFRNLFCEGCGPTSGVNSAKLIIWCFIAGFAERFVPDALDRLVSKGSSIQDRTTDARPLPGHEDNSA